MRKRKKSLRNSSFCSTLGDKIIAVKRDFLCSLKAVWGRGDIRSEWQIVLFMKNFSSCSKNNQKKKTRKGSTVHQLWSSLKGRGKTNSSTQVFWALALFPLWKGQSKPHFRAMAKCPPQKGQSKPRFYVTLPFILSRTPLDQESHVWIF